MSKGKNKYKNLIGNTLLFGISTFGSKILTLLFTPLITTYLTTEMNSAARLVTTACNFILPVMYVGIAESVIRFVMDKAYKKSDVFAVGFNTVVIGYAVLWALYPVVSRFPNVREYTMFVYMYVLTSAMRTLMTNFARASGFLRLFAIDGIVTTFLTAAGYVIFLVPLNLGVTGYLLATIVADGLSALGLFIILKLHRFVKIRGIDHVTLRDMFRYSIPMVPTAVFWWAISLSGQLFVNHFCGADINGVYVQAATIPNFIIAVSALFTRAWEMSAFTEYKSKESENFFSNVFRSYYTLIFLVASVVILLIKPATILLMPNEAYHEAWRFSPYIVLGVSFSCLVTFLGAIYNAFKQNVMITVTAFTGALVNVVLNLLLVPKYGAQGSAFALFISYLVVFVFRALDTRRYMHIAMQPMRIVVMLGLLLLQVWISLSEVKYWAVWESLILLLLVVINFGYIITFAKKMLGMLPIPRRKKSA